MFNLIAWYKKQLQNPSLDTKTYLEYERIVQEAERRQVGLDQEAAQRFNPK